MISYSIRNTCLDSFLLAFSYIVTLILNYCTEKYFSRQYICYFKAFTFKKTIDQPLSLENKMIMLGQAVKPKLQFVIPLTFLQLVLQTRGSQQSVLFHISYPAAPPKAIGEKLIWKFNPNEPGCLHAAKDYSDLGLMPQLMPAQCLVCGLLDDVTQRISVHVPGFWDHLIYDQQQVDKQAGWNVRNNLQIPLDTDHVIRETAKNEKFRFSCSKIRVWEHLFKKIHAW